MPSRRFHYKSRHGCLVCKARKVKCDRQRPACSLCIKRGEICAYNNDDCHSIQFIMYNSHARNDHDTAFYYYNQNPTFLTNPWPSNHAPLTRHPFNADLSLLEHFTTQVSYTLTDRIPVQTLYASLIVQIGFDHDYVAHSLLSVSALHLIQTENMSKAEARHHRLLSLHHQTAALALLRPQLALITAENCDSVYICGALIFIIAVASAQPLDPSTLLVRMGEFAELAHGVYVVIEGESTKALKMGRLKPFFNLEKWDHLICASPEQVPSKAVIGDLHNMIDLQPPELDPLKPIYRGAVQSLNLNMLAMHANPSHSAMIFMWLVYLTREFTALIAARDPVALRILQAYGEFSQRASDKWWAKQWGGDIVAGTRCVLQHQNNELFLPQRQMAGISREDCVAF
ncbi:hypothetical protein BGW36DRAFT_83297 [Talaromyces proteolyticus]|uniref:Zn(2)-C6 fungal-type domain-containing protein n=1 Tax=Talaromyces proteolyticus TaxID=1131652 RepID=A0AAD4PZL9_9EURO|nr:uncharacterized protein BGW36DRAFT_83297 [Talaromyces proteolyticus]KAH8703143.1 hypothetical protein BGW36DRAFT_83297 [Talaromyces proteolyticus]